MYRKNHPEQLKFNEFELKFGGKLNPENRWIKLASLIPWDKLEETYAEKMCDDNGRIAISFRIALGSQIIKGKISISDEETVEQIKENPYLQYFIGLDHFIEDQAPFEASSMTHFRKRINLDEINSITDMVDEHNKKDDDDKAPPSGHKGRLIIDASVSPQDIRFPTDTSLLSEAREKSEKLIDHLCLIKEVKKPRTYRKIAKKLSLAFAKKRKHSKREIRNSIRRQLQYLKRNIKSIYELTHKDETCLLSTKELKTFWVIQELFRQQMKMYKSKEHRVEHRIVSISQPHVRPIVRGKQKAKTEFGAKFSISVVAGMSYVDRLEWEAYNEAGDLLGQVKKYKERFGYYPECVCADKIYVNRKNREYLKELEIRFTAKALGRPQKEASMTMWQKRKKKKLERVDYCARNAVEGKFGVAKRRYGLGLNMMKLACTSEMWIGLIFLIMNLDTRLRRVIYFLFSEISVHLWEKRAGDQLKAIYPRTIFFRQAYARVFQ